MQIHALSSQPSSAVILGSSMRWLRLTKTIRVMQMTAILLTICSLSVTARSISQSVTFSGNKVPLEQIIKVIEQQTNFTVLYKKNLLAQTAPVTINASNTPLAEFLEQALAGQPISYSIHSSYITLQTKIAVENLNTPLLSPSLTAPPITGKVVGPDGQPIVGANVVVKGTQRGTITKADGEFTIEASDGEVIVISSVGFSDRLISIGTNRVIGPVLLVISESKLDEVQIMAYGKTSRRLNTGNITTVRASEIAQQPINNPLFALQGRVPGLQITPTSGLSGAAVNLQIRGNNSLIFTTSPLIVVDGLPIVNNIKGLGHSSLTDISSLSFLNPKDIESIDVLKDADATSIYGSRGANGVILITTKKGNAGKTSIDVSIQTGFSEVPQKVDLLKTTDYLELRKEAYFNEGIEIVAMQPDNTNADLTYWSQTRFTDWQAELLGKKAIYNDFQASISGGNKSVQYSIAGNFHRESTVFCSDDVNKKYTIRMSITGTTNDDKFKTTVSTIYQSDNNTLPGIDLTELAVSLPPNAPELYTKDGLLNWEYLPSGAISWNNPLAQLRRIYDANINNIITSADLLYKPTSNLSFRTTLGYNLLSGEAFRADAPFAAGPPRIGGTANSSFNNTAQKNLSIEPQIDFRSTIGAGILSILLGGTFQSTTKNDRWIWARGFTSDAMLRNLSAASAYFLNNNSSEYKYAAIFSRATYNFRNKYILNATVRRDGSSRFGPEDQFGSFGSIGAAWIFSEENFAKQLQFLTFGKLRMSYGSSGNDGIGDYQYLERYQSVDASDPYQGVRGYRSVGLYNSAYSWEATRKMEIGLDFGLFNERILLTAAYFRNRSNNQLLSYPLPAITGPSSNFIYNLPALIQNSGFEFQLITTNLKTKIFSWITSFNISANRNKLLSFPDLEKSPYSADFEVGKPFRGSVKLYNFSGVDPSTGQFQFKKNNGEFTTNPVDETQKDFGRYVRVLTDPNYYGGLTNNIRYRNFSLDFLLQFVRSKGLSPLNETNAQAGRDAENIPVDYLSRWQKPGDNTSIQKLFVNEFKYVEGIGYWESSTARYVDASFVRLKNLALSYTFPDGLLQRLHLSDFRLYVQGQNLFTLTSYKGFDPETQSLKTLPSLRILTFGIQSTF